MEDLGCAREKCAKVIAELDSKKGIGLIEKKRQGVKFYCAIHADAPPLYCLFFHSSKS